MGRLPTPGAFASIGSALLVSNEGETITLVSRSLQELALSPEVFVDVALGLAQLNRRKFSAVVVDLRLGPQAEELIQKVRLSPSNKTAVIFAITDSDAETTLAYDIGSSFVLRRPLSTASVEQTLKAAYGLILREQRRYFRWPVEASAVISRPGMRDVSGRVMNISEGGIAIISQVPLKPCDEVQLQFVLPGHGFRFVTQAIVCWRKEGFLGMQFNNPPAEVKAELLEWLSHRVEEGLPESTASKFRKA